MTFANLLLCDLFIIVVISSSYTSCRAGLVKQARWVHYTCGCFLLLPPPLSLFYNNCSYRCREKPNRNIRQCFPNFCTVSIPWWLKSSTCHSKHGITTARLQNANLCNLCPQSAIESGVRDSFHVKRPPNWQHRVFKNSYSYINNNNKINHFISDSLTIWIKSTRFHS